ncbi:hypothetical protein ACFY2R_22010 [Micromonospora olivasterospora]|uniref:ABC-type transport system involved in multi-copper enzyme maturation permease subunit n=1 Tax=Micromonospora olivasterospora TaxID=1880 RepID=A0A562I9Z3_MICOL|nr:hypothetical protein [Micromonospora olivasterospora]TWH67791.1 hypothetical protein JD77_02776 [Micromonospora olivasterospora]
MSGFWLHVRNSPIRWAFPVLVVLDLAVLFLRDRHWIGVWPETGAAGQVPAYLLGVFGAGAAAWSASAPRRQRVEEQLRAARVHPARVEAHRLTAALAVLLVPYLIGQVVAFAVTARTFPPGVHLWLGYVLLGLFAILLAVALGWACGRLLGPVFSAFAAAMGFLFLTVLLDRVGFVVVSGRPEVAVAPVPLALRLGLVVALLLVTLWLAGSEALRQRRRRAAALLPVALSLLVVMGATAVVADREPPGDQVLCLDGSTRLCIWPEHEKYLPELREINARIDDLPGAFKRPPLISEIGLVKSSYIGPDGTKHLDYEAESPVFHILEGSRWSYAGDIGKAITSATFAFQDLRTCDWMEITEPDQSQLAAIDKWLEAYLAGGGSPDYHTNAPEALQQAWTKGRAVAADLSRTDQFRWAEEEVNDLRGRYCRPGH